MPIGPVATCAFPPVALVVEPVVASLELAELPLFSSVLVVELALLSACPLACPPVTCACTGPTWSWQRRDGGADGADGAGSWNS